MSSLRFGLSRSHAGTDLDESAGLFAAALGERVGRRIAVTITSDYERLLDGVLVGAISVAWMPPLVHARAAALGAPLACVSRRGGALTYHAALLVRAESDYTAVADLHGARAAWADPYSASGSLFPQLHLYAAGIDPRYHFTSERHYGSVARACRAVAAGEADLCAHYISEAASHDFLLAHLELRRTLGEETARALRVLDVTDAIPPDGMVLAPLLAGIQQAHLRDALLSLHQDADGAAALHALTQAERLVPVTGELNRVISRLQAQAPGR